LASTLGQGTSVSFYLPRSDAAAEQAAARAPVRARAAASPEPTGHGMAVLVVEDDPRVSRSTVAALEELGYHPLACASGAEALEMLAREPQVALVVTDVMMPGMTGTELAAHVIRLYPAMKILFVTGYVGEAGEAGDLSGRELLRKPFTVAALAKAVAAAAGTGLSESHPAAADEAAE